MLERKRLKKRNVTLVSVVRLLSIALGGLSAGAHAEDAKKQGSNGTHPTEKLANQATNPGAALVQFQLQNQFIPDSNNSSGSANSFLVQPVIPIGKNFVPSEESHA